MNPATIRVDTLTREQQVALQMLLHPLDGVRPGVEEREDR